MSLDVGKARELLVAVGRAPTRDEMGRAAATLLNFLLRQLEELRELANGYPRNPIAGNVWFDGKALAEVCDELTARLAGRDLAVQEELASRLATGMALQVVGHYPEQIFPRVLRNGRCREALGQLAEAIGAYDAIVGDFDELGLAELLDEEVDDSSRVILECVRDAAERLCDLQPERAGELGELRALVVGVVGE